MTKLRVRDVMSRYVVVVGPDTSFKTVVDVLADYRVSAVPVIDAENRVVGIVSEADLLHKVEFAGGDGARLLERRRVREGRAKAAGDTAGELMSSPVVTVGADTTLREAARVMEAEGVKRLPVVAEDSGLRGIVSRRDLLRAYLRPDGDVAREVTDEVVRRMLAGDGAAVDVAVSRGVVTLSGTTDRRSSAEIAVRLTRAVDGVVDVVDKLSWERDDSADLRRRFVFDARL